MIFAAVSTPQPGMLSSDGDNSVTKVRSCFSSSSGRRELDAAVDQLEGDGGNQAVQAGQVGTDTVKDDPAAQGLGRHVEVRASSWRCQRSRHWMRVRSFTRSSR